MLPFHVSALFHCVVFFVLKSVESCGPGGAMFISRRLPRKLTPLVLKESWPSLDEFALSAAGPFTTVLTREHARFKELVPNYNPDIQFSDAEGTGEDHVMTRKCKEKLNMLAISVLNQYPGVKLRVLEAFDLEMVHSQRSLHYEGRAVDVSLSDRDRSKLGMLARLAVEAGFDYVKFSSRTHIHASVKLETGDVHRAGGCFSARSTVHTPDGQKALDQLRIGDEVLVATPSGELVYSRVILFLDVDETKRANVVIETESGASISLTPSHLLFVSEHIGASEFAYDHSVTFAKNVRVGHYLYVKTTTDALVLDRVVNVTMTYGEEHVAPLTNEGTIVVNNVVASCYAIIENHRLAHAAFAPMRMYLNSKEVAKHFLKTLNVVDIPTKKTRTKKTDKNMGIHTYALWLYKLGYIVLPEDTMYQ